MGGCVEIALQSANSTSIAGSSIVLPFVTVVVERSGKTTGLATDQKPVMKKEQGGRKRLRSGIYTSAILAITEEELCPVLFQIDIGHAGTRTAGVTLSI